MTLDTTIGIYNYTFEDTSPITIGELRNELHANPCFLKWDSRELCDWRYSTCLTRFRYDPYTGEKLDWKEIKKMLDGTE